MSNYLAIAAATETLRTLLDEAAKAAVSGADVSVGRPEDAEPPGQQGQTSPSVNVFLFQVSHNAAWRNADLPTRRADGSLTLRPQIALNLHYLLSFYGNDKYEEPQRLLGAAVSALHAEPVLTKERILATISDAMASPNPSFHYLGQADLAEQVESVRFTPLPLNLEELSKLWSVFFQIPYSLSVAYQASVVLIESEKTPQRALPVKARGVYAVPFQHPKITSVEPETGQGDPVYHDSTLIIRGEQLRGEITRVQAGGKPVLLDAKDILMDRIKGAVPAGLQAGIQGVQVIHEHEMGDPPEDHQGVVSNIFPFVLRPKITVDQPGVTAAQIPIEFDPDIGIDQKVKLFLNEMNAPDIRRPYAYMFDAPKDNGIVPPDETTGSITFPISDVNAGDYLVRVLVDGAESMLSAGGSGKYDQPKVTI